MATTWAMPQNQKKYKQTQRQTASCLQREPDICTCGYIERRQITDKWISQHLQKQQSEKSRQPANCQWAEIRNFTGFNLQCQIRICICLYVCMYATWGMTEQLCDSGFFGRPVIRTEREKEKHEDRERWRESEIEVRATTKM